MSDSRNSFSQKKRNYYKRNQVAAMEIITPGFYIDEDLSLSGKEVDPIEQLVNSHINIANNISDILFVSGLNDTYLSALNSMAGISSYFIKQNGLSNIKPSEFERNILSPLGKSFRDFTTSDAFVSFLDSDYFPATILNSPSSTAFGNGVDTSTAHHYLTSSLSWLYFLNTSGDGDLDYYPSSIARDMMVTNLYVGKDIKINDCIKGLEEFVVKNYTTCSTWEGLDIIPTDYLSSTGTYTSGYQQLDKLKTLIDVAYSPLHLDSKDTLVKDAFQDFISAETYLSTQVSKGPFRRLLTAFGFLMGDVNDQIDTISVFNDIDECPDHLLKHLAELIGWKLFSYDPTRWRLQLQNAVSVYKAAGTKKSIQLAVNSIFSDDAFNVSGSITELWESYIPDLIYYSLATESSLLKDFTTWDFQKAKSLGVDTFSEKSMDENLRIATDNIILKLVKEFPEDFKVGKNPFPVGDPSFIFNYRGRNFPIPPFEEHPYYVNTDIHERMITEIVDLLVCFGVGNTFAIQVGEFIRNNTIKSTEDIAIQNGWLIFTSGMEVPDNWGDVVNDVTPERDEYLGLWSGKSSHYQLDFNASSFNFSKDTLTSDSKLAVPQAARAADSFAPVNAIRNTSLLLGENDEWTGSSVLPTYVQFDRNDDYASSDFSDQAFSRSQSAGVPMNLYKRGPAELFESFNISASVGTDSPREDLDSDGDSLINTSGGVLSLPRNAFRRRNYHGSLQTGGYYDRTGFNMPVSWDVASSSIASGTSFLPLGFIPSSCSFQEIADYGNLPAVYGKCEGLTSDSHYYGFDVSNAFACRGLSSLGSDAKNTAYLEAHSNYVDRGQLDPFLATIHSIDSQKELMVSSSDLSGGFDRYENYRFGRDIHKLYKDYTKHFNRHTLAKRIVDENGANIFAHCYGSIFRNSDFEIPGELAEANTSLIANTIQDAEHAVMVYSDTGAFGPDGATALSSTFFASSTTDAITDEYRSAKIVSGVEYIMPSGSDSQNHIITYDLNYDTNQLGNEKHSLENAMVKLKSVTDMPRVAFDLKSYFTTEDVEVNNLLIPDHLFNLSVKALIGNEKVDKKGGATMGVWIHTAPETVGDNSYVWSLTEDNEWVMDAVSGLDRDRVFKVSHLQTLSSEDRTLPGSDLKCAVSVEPPSDPLKNHGVIPTYKEEEFHTINIKFNTRNSILKVPESYYSDYQQVHRPNQNYRVEIFMLPHNFNREKFLLIDKIDFTDLTQYERTRIGASSVESEIVETPLEPLEQVLTVDLQPEELWTILVQYNGMAGALDSRTPLNSRIASKTEAIMDVSGGSRLNYRINPAWEGKGAFFPDLGTFRAVDRYSSLEGIN